MNKQSGKSVIILLIILSIFIFTGLLFKLYKNQSTNSPKLPLIQPVPSQEVSLSPSNSQNSCKLIGPNNQNIGNNKDTSVCIVTVPLEWSLSYQLEYPNSWSKRLAGASGIDLIFNENSQQSILIQAVSTRLALEQSDQAVTTSEKSSDRIIASTESLIHKNLITVSDKNVLLVSTHDNKNNYSYYFVQLKGSVNKWLFSFKIIDNPDTKTQLENLIGTLKLIPGGVPKDNL